MTTQKLNDAESDGVQTKRPCTELGLGGEGRFSRVRAQGFGIISSRLSSLTDLIRVGVSIYKLGPSLFISNRCKTM